MVERASIIRWIVDILAYGIILIMWQHVDLKVPKIIRPFVCKDASLSFPYKKSTVRGVWLHYYFYGSMIFITISELLLEAKNSILRDRFKIILMRSLVWFKYYFISFIALVIVSSTIKNLYGSHRPFFFEVCQPDALKTCIPGELVISYNCTNTNFSSYVIFESQRSFPSGHTYSVTYSTFVLIYYIQMRFREMPSKIVVVFLHLLIAVWTAFCCVTRVSDNWHHPIDVVGAIIITIPFPLYSCIVLCKNFEKKMSM